MKKQYFDVQLNYPEGCLVSSTWIRVKTTSAKSAVMRAMRTGPKAITAAGEYLRPRSAYCAGEVAALFTRKRVSA